MVRTTLDLDLPDIGRVDQYAEIIKERSVRRRLIQTSSQIIRDCLDGLSEKVIGLLGLAFKPNTDDLREAPSLDIARVLIAAGAHVRAYDPAAMERTRAILPELEYTKDAYELAAGADALVVVTEWNEFKHLDMTRLKTSMRKPVVIDGRNIYVPATMRELGFIYRGIGRE